MFAYPHYLEIPFFFFFVREGGEGDKIWKINTSNFYQNKCCYFNMKLGTHFFFFFNILSDFENIILFFTFSVSHRKFILKKRWILQKKKKYNNKIYRNE